MTFFRQAASLPRHFHACGVEFWRLRAPRLNSSEADSFAPVATILPSRERQRRGTEALDVQIRFKSFALRPTHSQLKGRKTFSGLIISVNPQILD